MDLSNFASPVAIGSGVVIAVGLFGVLLPFVPGLVLCWLGVLGWAILSDSGRQRWVILGIATLIGVLGLVAKYAVPGRNLKRAGVPTLSLFVGGVLGIVGFFVIPVIGLVLGFVLGIWLAELIRLGSAGGAWRATRHALGAVGLALLIEVTAGLFIAITWAAGVALT